MFGLDFAKINELIPQFKEDFAHIRKTFDDMREEQKTQTAMLQRLLNEKEKNNG